jgi:hypothetical protein
MSWRVRGRPVQGSPLGQGAETHRDYLNGANADFGGESLGPLMLRAGGEG